MHNSGALVPAKSASVSEAVSSAGVAMSCGRRQGFPCVLISLPEEEGEERRKAAVVTVLMSCEETKGAVQT